MVNPIEEPADSEEKKDNHMDIASLMITPIFSIAMNLMVNRMDLSFLPTLWSVVLYILLSTGLALVIFSLLLPPLKKMLGKRNKQVPIGYAIVAIIAVSWFSKGINFILAAL